MEELLDIEPFKDEMYDIWQGDSVHDKPFFRVVSTVEMEKADISCRRLRELRIRAGYLRRITFASIIEIQSTRMCVIGEASLGIAQRHFHGDIRKSEDLPRCLGIMLRTFFMFRPCQSLFHYTQLYFSTPLTEALCACGGCTFKG